MARYEAGQPVPRGLGVDWKTEARIGLSEAEAFGIYCFMSSSLQLPPDLLGYEGQIKAILITSYFIGHSYSRLGPLTERILRIPATDDERDALPKLFHNTFSLISSGRELFSYKQSRIEAYIFMASLDEETCPICGKLDKKVFSTLEAQIGKNYPPMHPGCRCTAIAYSEDGYPHMRRAKNSVTGESELIEDISWSEWAIKNKT